MRLAHCTKECFYDICQIDAYSQQQREFDDWITNALNCGIKEFEDCARTYRTLRKEILNALKYGLTNDSTEGFNYKIKILKRSSHGI
ncbi:MULTISPECIES: transposase [Hungatella]|uniref:transposase n=1 Tax=Hungatella sp. TaxID=2613924 RepID=UPI0032E50D4E